MYVAPPMTTGRIFGGSDWLGRKARAGKCVCMYRLRCACETYGYECLRKRQNLNIVI